MNAAPFTYLYQGPGVTCLHLDRQHLPDAAGLMINDARNLTHLLIKDTCAIRTKTKTKRRGACEHDPGIDPAAHNRLHDTLLLEGSCRRGTLHKGIANGRHINVKESSQH
ncbi:hypothetical protein E2C01_035925 [Portunus trituberculatus]|uniref:Uncharacterized protein n=1 Tax=Portunus trituberculatus TaxID=210409 RepID=A0A5B7FAG5_PORTR|nr:hypothetical protein [Portunus trituberculatus]